MKQFLTVLRFELNNYFKNKSFMITTILLALAVAGVIIIPTMIPGLLGGNSAKDEQEKLGLLGICVNTAEVENVDGLLDMMPAEWVLYEDEESLKQAVEDEVVNGGFVLNSPDDVKYVVMNLTISDRIAEDFEQAMNIWLRQRYLTGKGLTAEEIQAADSLAPSITPEILGKDSAKNYAYTYVLVFSIYFLIIFYGQMIAVSVTTEKSNRAIEILVTSVNPNSLIFGKVLAGALSGILQMIIILGAAFAAYGAFREAWGGALDFLLHVPAKVLIAFAFFGIMSYLLYAFIFGMLGALVSKTEDISKSSMPVTLIYVASFLIAMMGLTDCDSMMIKVASFIPFSSGNAMFIRISMGSVAVWEIAVSGAVLLLSCVVTGILAARLFRFGTLHYGNPMKFTKALKGAREQN
ncbi:ABC transporter permease [Ruminococcus sp. 5_1_39BFAA]|uniref:ABC transporter permease n=1 Tax=Ruminococcus sp. 5_1_39BFAA TaxID=457412 RepID=UPI00356846D3